MRYSTRAQVAPAITALVAFCSLQSDERPLDGWTEVLGGHCFDPRGASNGPHWALAASAPRLSSPSVHHAIVQRFHSTSCPPPGGGGGDGAPWLPPPPPPPKGAPLTGPQIGAEMAPHVTGITKFTKNENGTFWKQSDDVEWVWAVGLGGGGDKEIKKSHDWSCVG